MAAVIETPVGIGRDVLYEVVDGQIGVIRLNRPDRRNAVDSEVTKALAHLVEQTEADVAIRVVILTSSHPGFFCAGADLAVIAAGEKDDLVTVEGGFAGLTHAKRTKPWVAAVAGPVLAGGFELCLACDMIVASDTALFGLPEVKRGLFAAAGGVYRAARTLPRNVALELVTTGDPMTAERAFAFGLVNRLTSSHTLLDEALSLSRAVAANAPISVSQSLALARVANEASDDDLKARADAAARIVFSTQDAQEGSRAFLEKRAPRWVGR